MHSPSDLLEKRPSKRRGRRMTVLGVLASAALLQTSCATSGEDWGGTEPIFSDAPLVPVGDVCVETVCPAPYATCPGERGLCTVDLRADIDHCGACDTPCPTPLSK